MLALRTAATAATATATATRIDASIVSPPAKTYRYHWEDFPVGQQRQFGATVVTREAIIDFAQQFDPQPFHVDEVAARESLFGGLCASGWHSCAMAMRMMCDEVLLDSASLGSPGMDELRWLKPVFPGDTLSVRLTVLDSRPMASRPKVGLMRAGWELCNQRGEVVMTMSGWGMFGRRHAAAADGAPADGKAPTPQA